MSTAFISYTHDSSEQIERVGRLAYRLREDGIDVDLDQWVESPPEGWPKWMERQIRQAHFVLVVCTKTYNQRFHGAEELGCERGGRWESLLTYQHIYDANSENLRFIPILFRSDDEAAIPTALRGATYYEVSTDEGYHKLYRRLTNQPGRVKPPLGSIKPLPPLASFGSAAAASSPLPQAFPPPFAMADYTSGLRNFIMKMLATDSDLDAFCFDFFPSIKQRFSNGMDRVAKVTLLLECEDAECIVQALKKSHADRFSRYLGILQQPE